MLVPRERRSGETRVAATPETVKRLIAQGAQVWIEAEAGRAAGFSDADFDEAGAKVFATGESLERWSQADVVLSVQAPLLSSEGGDGRLEALPAGSLVLGLLDPYRNQALIDQLELGRVSSLALELLPRISRAQAMDVLSSQANIAGYKAVLLAAAALDRFFPMLMTAAGTVQPAKVVVLGAGVAGLQAVATARRLGAVVRVSDVRPAAREQVESLGARFIEPPQLEEAPGEAGGYAREAGAVFQEAQRQILAEQLKDADVVICTAQVPGRPAPLLITEAMLAGMRPGSVVVDLAVAQGGNCAASRDDGDAWVGGVLVIGAGNLAASVPQHASTLYARNLVSLLEVVLKEGSVSIDPQDPLLDPCLLTHGGACRRPDLRPARKEATA